MAITASASTVVFVPSFDERREKNCRIPPKPRTIPAKQQNAAGNQQDLAGEQQFALNRIAQVAADERGPPMLPMISAHSLRLRFTGAATWTFWILSHRDSVAR